MRSAGPSWPDAPRSGRRRLGWQDATEWTVGTKSEEESCEPVIDEGSRPFATPGFLAAGPE